MSQSDYTHLTLVVDRSGSMSNLAQEVSNNINELVKEQREIDTGKITMSIIQFDDRYEAVEQFVPAAFVEPYTLSPRGMTALNDSLYKAIVETEDRINTLPDDEQPANVIITVVTDGYENASREVTHTQLKELISRREKDGWNFVFMASNIDARQAASQYGIVNTRNMQHNSGSYAQAYSSLSSTIATTRTTNTSFDAAWAADEENN